MAKKKQPNPVVQRECVKIAAEVMRGMIPKREPPEFPELTAAQINAMAPKVLKLLRKMVMSQIKMWDAATELEHLLGVEFDSTREAEPWAVMIDTADQITLEQAKEFIREHPRQFAEGEQ
jgi:hypothetical protein